MYPRAAQWGKKPLDTLKLLKKGESPSHLGCLNKKRFFSGGPGRLLGLGGPVGHLLHPPTHTCSDRVKWGSRKLSLYFFYFQRKGRGLEWQKSLCSGLACPFS